MGAMYEFLTSLDSEAVRALYQNLDALWNSRAQSLNDRLAAANLPVRIANLSTIWTICYTQPSRYNWMFQYYLRAAGLALSWVGTGRIIFSLNYTAADFAAVADRIVAAAAEMQRDGWWWPEPLLTNGAIRRRLLREMLQARFSSGSGSASTSPIGSISSPRIK
jgi:glutamate-1-semialdehyde 2,1-aminomutase